MHQLFGALMALAVVVDQNWVAAKGGSLVRDKQAKANLQYLNLYHTLVTEKGYGALKAALPKCEIVFDRDSAQPTRRGS